MSSHPAGLKFSHFSSTAESQHQQQQQLQTAANQKIMQQQQHQQNHNQIQQSANQTNKNQIYNSGNLENFSDSETDVSNSIENLSLEDRFVLRHTTRVEPQGQENMQDNAMSARYNINGSRLSSNTSTDSTRYPSSNRSMSETRNHNIYSQQLSQSQTSSQSGNGGGVGVVNVGLVNAMSSNTNPNRNSLKENNSNRSSMDASTCSYNTLIIHNDDNVFSNDYTSSPPYLNKKDRPRSYGEKAMQDITEIPDEYLENTQVLKNLAKELNRNKISNSNDGRDSNISENMLNPDDPNGNCKAKSKSQPDLTRFGDIDLDTFETLMKENAYLKTQLNNCLLKVAKTQKLEDEVSKIYRAHEELEQSCQRREKLELTIRSKLQSELQRAQELNRMLRDQIEMHQSQLLAPSEHQILIAQLFTQNKEIAAAKERQEIELAAQRATLQEQRNHIGILDSALTNTQNNMRRLEEELRKKTLYIEHLVKIQQNSMQAKQNDHKCLYDNELSKDSNRSGSSTATDTKWQLDKDGQISRLENECAKLDQRHLDESKTANEADRIILEAKQEKIRYLEEVHTAKKKVGELQNHLKGLESRLAEKDAFIRALQGQKNYGSSNSYDSYNMSNDSFALNPLVYNSQTSFNVSNSSFNTNVNASLLDPPYSTQNTGSFNPGNSYSPGYISSHPANKNYGQTNSGYNQSALNLQSITLPSNYSTNSQKNYNNNFITSESNYISPNSNSSSYDTNSFDHQYDVTRKSIDDHMKNKLDEQLLSKRGLCCFPGLTGKKTIQSLLSDEVSVLSTNNSDAFLQKLVHLDQRERERKEMCGANNLQKPEDIMMLEKQGRCSQKIRNNPIGNLVQVSQSVGQNMTDISNIGSQSSKVPKIVANLTQNIANITSGSILQQPRKDRGASLPPSALPRPPRSLKQPRKIEYDRLNDSEHKKRSQTPPNHSERSYELKTSSLKRGEFEKKEYSPAANCNIKQKNYGSIHQTNEYPFSKNYTRLEDSKIKYNKTKKESSPSQKRSLLPSGRTSGSNGQNSVMIKTSRDSINSASSGTNSNNSRASPIHTKTDSNSSNNNIIFQHTSGQFNHARTPPKYIRLTPPPSLQHPHRQMACSQGKISQQSTASNFSNPQSSSSLSLISASASLPPKPAQDSRNSKRGVSVSRNENRYRIQF